MKYKPIHVEFVNPVKFIGDINASTLLKLETHCKTMEIDKSFLKVVLKKRLDKVYLVPMINVSFMEVEEVPEEEPTYGIVKPKNK